MEDEYVKSQHEKYAEIVARLKESVEMVDRLPEQEREMARMAIDGADVYEIAQLLQISVAAVRARLGWIAEGFSGQPAGGTKTGYESGGLWADTEPGSTGAYGEAAFEATGEEPPFPETEEEG